MRKVTVQVTPGPHAEQCVTASHTVQESTAGQRGNWVSRVVSCLVFSTTGVAALMLDINRSVQAAFVVKNP